MQTNDDKNQLIERGPRVTILQWMFILSMLGLLSTWVLRYFFAS